MANLFALLCIVFTFTSPVIMASDLATGLAIMLTGFGFGIISAAVE